MDGWTEEAKDACTFARSITLLVELVLHCVRYLGLKFKLTSLTYYIIFDSLFRRFYPKELAVN